MNKKCNIILLFAMSAIFLIPCVSSAFDLELLEKDVEELSARLDEVEKQTLLDKIKIGAEIRTRSDWYRYLDHDNDIDDGTSIQSTRFRLNMMAKATDNLQFHARLTMLKNWIDNDIPGYPGRFDPDYARIPSDSTLKVERAYMDYFFDILPIAVTIGRLPFTDGLTTDLREDTPRKAVYPVMAYDLEGEGIGLSIMLDKWIPMPDIAIRGVYSNLTVDDDLEFFRNDTQYADPIEIFSAQFETGFPGIFKDTLLVLNYVFTEMGSPDQFISENILGKEIAAAAGVPVSLVTVTPDQNQFPGSLGSMEKYLFLIESKNFLNTYLDLFFCYGKMRINPNGNGPVVWNVSIFGSGLPAIPVSGGLGSSLNLNKTREGESIYCGARFTIPLERINKKFAQYSPKIGYEYNKGSRYWIGSSWGSEDPLEKLNTRGRAHDFYYIQPIDNNFTIRIGRTEVDYDYANSGGYYEMGASIFGPLKENKKITNTYVLLDMKF